MESYSGELNKRDFKSIALWVLAVVGVELLTVILGFSDDIGAWLCAHGELVCKLAPYIAPALTFIIMTIKKYRDGLEKPPTTTEEQ